MHLIGYAFYWVLEKSRGHILHEIENLLGYVDSVYCSLLIRIPISRKKHDEKYYLEFELLDEAFPKGLSFIYQLSFLI